VSVLTPLLPPFHLPVMTSLSCSLLFQLQLLVSLHILFSVSINPVLLLAHLNLPLIKSVATSTYTLCTLSHISDGPLLSFFSLLLGLLSWLISIPVLLHATCSACFTYFSTL
jgi:hypothetical protein